MNKMINDEQLANKYRPKTFDEVVGQEIVTESIKKLFKQNKVPKVFLFVSPPGCGKTTLGRIIGNQLQCSEFDITELDAGVFTGIDSVRELINTLNFAPIGNGINKLIIIDEFHLCSKQAFGALLKTLEELPQHVYFCLCTTDLKKIPNNIQTRCHIYKLKPVSIFQLIQFLEKIVTAEKIEIDLKFLDIIAKNANGSPRMALMLLSKCRNAKTIEEVQELSNVITETLEIKELCFKLINGQLTLIETIKYLKSFKEQELEPESIRLVIVGYIQACVFNAKNKQDLEKFILLLTGFRKPIFTDSYVDLILGFAESLY